MSLAIVFSRAQSGIDAPLVTVEVHLSGGLPALAIVGLPETAVRESRERVRAAILNAGFEFPLGRVTINLAPAELPKAGGRYDLAIALGILAASGQLPATRLRACEFLGELALTGELRPVHGVLPAVLRTRDDGRCLIAPLINAAEAALVPDAPVHGAQHLLEVCAHLAGRAVLPQITCLPPRDNEADDAQGIDIAEIRGQLAAKRALAIAAAGGHNLLMIGPPGAGKTSLALRFPGILPPMNETEAIETATIHSIDTRGFRLEDWRRRPFRTPHHTSSAIALAGGGSVPQPGEVSLAHHGVLFLDELPEFSRHVLEVLREPLESGRITVSRARRRAEFPAAFQLIAAMNPCPCGWLGTTDNRCRCTSEQIDRYRARISGPLLDRIDLHVELPPVDPVALRQAFDPAAMRSADIRARVITARDRQLARDGKPAHRLTPGEIERSCVLDIAAMSLLERAAMRFGFSARAHHGILKVARTIADLDGADGIEEHHLGEAVGYRVIDRRLSM